MDIEDQEESSKRELQLQRFKLCNCELLVYDGYSTTLMNLH
jgi:hypothetical protein